MAHHVVSALLQEPSATTVKYDSMLSLAVGKTLVSKNRYNVYWLVAVRHFAASLGITYQIAHCTSAETPSGMHETTRLARVRL